VDSKLNLSLSSTPGSTSSENPFIAAARAGNTRLWTYAATLALVILMLLIWETVLTLPLVLAVRSVDLNNLPEVPLLVVELLSFAAIPAGLWLGLRWLHRRRFASLFSPARRFRWGSLALAGAAWLGMSALSDLVQALLHPALYTWSFDLARFWPYALAALALFPIQVAGEELLFRGYLTQAVGVKTNIPWLALAGPAVLFGLLHLANPEVATYGWGWMLPQYIGLGLLLGGVTLRSAGLEEALGLHLANNLYAALGVTMAGSALPSPALFTLQAYDPRAGLVVLVLTGGLYLLLSELARRKALRVGVLAGLLVLLAACSGPAPTSPSPTGLLALTDCTLSRTGFSVQVAARCGQLEVPENSADPGGRKIHLNIAVVKAQSSMPSPEPVFLLAGGPGQAATEAYLPILSSLDKIGFKHDLVLIDQRGTGKSNPLSCGEDLGKDLPVGRSVGEQQIKDAFTACLKTWDSDPRFYTTAAFSADLEEARKALGYGPIDLLGVSYGTRSALDYARLYPANVHAMVLDGVVPPEWVLGSSLRRDASRAMDLIFARCAAEPGCSKAFPDLKNDLDGLLVRLKAQPAKVTIPDPTTAQDTSVEVSDITARSMLRLITYSSDYSALIPLLIHTAAQGDLRPLAAQYAIAQKQDVGIYSGLFYAVVCSEDMPFLAPGEETGDYYAVDALKEMRAICSVYPSNPQPQGERVFPTLPIPTLILSGEDDPVTPPSNGEAAAKYLPNSKQIVAAGMGHGNSTVGCIPNLIRQLFDEGSVAGIDASCAKRIAPPAFFTSLVGPEP
jgi:pimeloyl-ACP methyl ester carboxylesterase/membrane protease YdiL (CAAX protease family)